MQRYRKEDIVNNRFYQLPKFLFNEHFIKLSNDAKVLYSLLRDRHDLSIVNDWVNDKGEVYLIYSQANMSSMLCRTPKTIRKIMKELKDYELIDEVRQGVNKPNLIYLNQLDVGQVNITHQDRYILPTNDTEVIKTEKRYIHLSEKDDYISFYKSQFKRVLGKEHMKVSEDSISYINSMVEEIRMYDVEIDDWKEVVKEHFNNLSNSNNGNILAFLSASKRYFEVDNINY